MTTGKKRATDENKAKKCAHPACNCKARADDPYCSDTCKKHVGAGQCACEHSGCKTD
jgi:hypothetical protein